MCNFFKYYKIKDSLKYNLSHVFKRERYNLFLLYPYILARMLGFDWTMITKWTIKVLQNDYHIQKSV